MYRVLWHVPAHDQRLQSMTNHEFELEVRAYFELQKVMSGEKKPGPSRAFVDTVKQMMQKADTAPVTPKDLGWET